MAIYYCGPGGNNANSGLDWANRKLTLNGCEDVPITAGSTVYVAPGVYREMLTCDVSGAAGSPITYIGDVSGENTDGVGGVVRITGSDNDTTMARVSCVTSANRTYRTFRGFHMDLSSSHLVSCTSGTNWIIQDCTFNPIGAFVAAILISGASQAQNTIRRCKILVGTSNGRGCSFTHAATLDNVGHLMENCTIIGGGQGIYDDRVGGITIRECTVISCTAIGIRIGTALTVGQTVTVNNSIVYGCAIGLSAINVGEITENYNSLSGNATAYQNVTAGAQSNTYPPLFDLGILHSGASQVSGFRFPPPLFGALSQWSQVRAIADTGAATEDILGLTRPVTAGKRSWGAVQYVDMARDTGTVHAGVASKKLADAGRDQIYVPTTNVSTVFSVYVYREANYAGVNPQMIIKQPGQADTVVTDAGAAGAWNLLTTTLTPAALPGYVVIELTSGNTAAAGNYAVYFDDLTVT